MRAGHAPRRGGGCHEANHLRLERRRRRLGLGRVPADEHRRHVFDSASTARSTDGVHGPFAGGHVRALVRTGGVPDAEVHDEEKPGIRSNADGDGGERTPRRRVLLHSLRRRRAPGDPEHLSPRLLRRRSRLLILLEKNRLE